MIDTAGQRLVGRTARLVAIPHEDHVAFDRRYMPGPTDAWQPQHGGARERRSDAQGVLEAFDK